ncbi:MAG: hypothetical protein M1828_005191 [Chrysothrix sp. TS-e1954]|nr:MAG: hypothetical protein M1828_005191 [Chrysothrix sp. TS-e1954]
MERIDVHSHVVTSGYRQYLIENGHEKPDGMPAIPAWDAEHQIALMGKLNISKSILSVSSPGTHLTPADDHHAALMTRRANEELSIICRTHARHFRFFASLPMPAVRESIIEIDYALDELGAVGFILLSNAHGVYLGDDRLDPIFEKLNSREAVVFIHPKTCNVLGSEGQVQTVKPLEQYPRPMMEFMFDETRAVANLLLSGTVSRCSRIKLIVSHCGCAISSLIDRIGGFASLLEDGENKSDEFKVQLRTRFFFDLAGFPFPTQIHGLLKLLGEHGEQRLLYGTDSPFTPENIVSRLADQMDEGCREMFDDSQIRNIGVLNAQRLFAGALD